MAARAEQILRGAGPAGEDVVLWCEGDGCLWEDDDTVRCPYCGGSGSGHDVECMTDIHGSIQGDCE